MLRHNIRRVLINCQKGYWPKENVARAKYYLSLILRATPGYVPVAPVQPVNISFTSKYQSMATDLQACTNLEALSRADHAELFASEAKVVLDELVTQEEQKALLEGHDGDAREAVVYDFMAPWGYRVIVDQRPLSSDIAADIVDVLPHR